MIKLEGVSKTYASGAHPALQDISLEIEKGEFVFLVGSSGSGKSTLLRMMLKEERPTIGTIYVAGKDLNKLPSWKLPALRRGIGTVFQDFRLLPNKTVEQNIAFERIFSRLKNLRFVEGKNDFTHHPNVTLRAMKELWIEWDV